MSGSIKEKLYLSTDKTKAEYLLELIDKKIQKETEFIDFLKKFKKKEKELSQSALWRYAEDYLVEFKIGLRKLPISTNFSTILFKTIRKPKLNI